MGGEGQLVQFVCTGSLHCREALQPVQHGTVLGVPEMSAYKCSQGGGHAGPRRQYRDLQSCGTCSAQRAACGPSGSLRCMQWTRCDYQRSDGRHCPAALSAAPPARSLLPPALSCVTGPQVWVAALGKAWLTSSLYPPHPGSAAALAYWDGESSAVGSCALGDAGDACREAILT